MSAFRQYLIKEDRLVFKFSSSLTPKRSLQRHVELRNEEVNVVLLFGLERLGDEAGCFSMLSSSQRDPVHLKNHLAHLQLPAVMSWASSLKRRENCFTWIQKILIISMKMCSHMGRWVVLEKEIWVLKCKSNPPNETLRQNRNGKKKKERKTKPSALSSPQLLLLDHPFLVLINCPWPGN